MKDKEKQIEEMAMIMCENDCEECRRESIEFYGNSYEEETQCVFNAGAEKLYEQGYRKIPKDSVVLTREEYQKDFSSQFNKGYKHGSKETAEKILAEMQEFFRPFDKKSPIFLDLLLTKLENIVKQCCVETKE